MELVLTRIAKRKTYTIGKLYIVERIDDEYLAGSKEVYFCDTLEPTVLELKTSVSKETVLRSPKKAESLKPFAIPEGRYAVVITWSPKFKMIQDVAPCASRRPRLQPSLQGHPYSHGQHRRRHRWLHPRRPQPDGRQSARITQMALRAQAEDRRGQGQRRSRLDHHQIN